MSFLRSKIAVVQPFCLLLNANIQQFYMHLYKQEGNADVYVISVK